MSEIVLQAGAWGGAQQSQPKPQPKILPATPRPDTLRQGW